MELNQLKKGAELNKQIEDAKERLSLWSSSTMLSNGNIYIDIKGRSGIWVNCSPETFTILKALNISFFQNKVADLEQQFSEI